MKTMGKRVMSFFFAFAMAMTLLIVNVPTTSYAATNTAVTDARTGVVQVNLLYRDDNNTYQTLGYGSGFLVNSNTIITCAHVINLTDAQIQYYIDNADILAGKKIAEVKDRIAYSVTIARDVTINATLLKQSVDMDFAIMTLEQSIQNKNPLTIAKSSEVSQTETVFAIGYPDESQYMETVPTYTSEDATITSGSVNKVTTGSNLYSGQQTDYIQTSVSLTEGNSGGPLVNENGEVIGVCEGSTGDQKDDHYFYAVAIDQVTDILDSIGVQYAAAGTVAVESNTEDATEAATEAAPVVDKTTLSALISENDGKYEEKNYESDSFGAYTTALEAAKKVNDNADATQEDVDKAKNDLTTAIAKLQQKSGLSPMLIAALAAIAVVIIIIVILLVVLGGKKKKKPAQKAAPQPNYAGQGTVPVQPQPSNNSFRPAPMAPANDAGETTVLMDGGAGETTLLSRNVNGGTLIRKNGERVAVNAEEFVIGREKTRVNYCVAGNTTIGRTHAKIVVRNGAAYLVDLKATNGTFLNGIKCMPMQEMPLKSGDKITLSDEEFTYQA